MLDCDRAQARGVSSCDGRVVVGGDRATDLAAALPDRARGVRAGTSLGSSTETVLEEGADCEAKRADVSGGEGGQEPQEGTAPATPTVGSSCTDVSYTHRLLTRGRRAGRAPRCRGDDGERQGSVQEARLHGRRAEGAHPR